MHGLDALLANRSQLIVLRALARSQGPQTGRAVQRACGLSNRATMMALDALVDLGTVNRETTPGAHHYLLNTEHYLLDKALMPAFDAEDHFWQDVARTVRRTVRPRPIAAVATGPLARDETQYGGRLVLTMLFSTGRSRIRSLRTAATLSRVITERYALTLDTHLLDLNTMDREEYTPLWRRVEREGILLFGTLP